MRVYVKKGVGGGAVFFYVMELKVSQLLGTLGSWIHVLALQHIPVLALSTLHYGTFNVTFSPV